MRFFCDPSTDTESEVDGSTVISSKDIKGKGKARELDSELASPPPRRTSVRVRSPPASRARSRDLDHRRASTSSASSLSDSEASDNEDDDDDSGSLTGDSEDFTDSEGDSEEDEFPVNPSKQELAARRRLNQYPAQSDPLESYLAKQQKKAWQLAQASHNRDLAALRNIRLNAFAQAQEKRKRIQEHELENTRLLLENMDMRRQREEAEIDREFTDRNTARWADINRAISELEKAEDAAVAAAKKKQQEAEQKAKEMREAEMKKTEAEKEALRKKEEEKQEQARAAEEQRAKATKAAEERQRKEKEDASRAAVGVPAGGAALAGTAASSSTGSALLDSKRQFEHWHSKVKELKETVLPAVSSNKELKNACYKLKRSLTTRISNVSASASDVRETATHINNLLNDAKGANEQAYLWSLNLLSKKITEMAGNNSEPDLSPVTYALGQIVVALLLADHKAFGDILMARLVKRCPYVVPCFPSKGNLSPNEHAKLLGKKESEPPISYKQRMSGIISLYAAILQTSSSAVPQLSPQSSADNIPAHFRPQAGWRWLATIVRPPLPLLDTTALVLYTYLRMASERFHELFGKQFIKLLRAIAEQAIDAKVVKWNDSVMGDISKVRIMIGEWMQSGQIKGAEGRTPK